MSWNKIWDWLSERAKPKVPDINSQEKSQRIGNTIDATLDINASQLLEIRLDGKLHRVDPFRLSFENPDFARTSYANMFSAIRKLLNDNENSKLTVLEIGHNGEDIATWKTRTFQIKIIIKDGESREYKIGTLLSQDDFLRNLQCNFWELGVTELPDYGISAITRDPKNAFSCLFQTSLWGWNHNISQNMDLFYQTKYPENGYKPFFRITPQDLDKDSPYYVRASLMYNDPERGKTTLRVDPNKELIKNMNEALIRQMVSGNITDVLMTEKNWESARQVLRASKSVNINVHFIPSEFDYQAFEDNVSSCFNSEPKELGNVLRKFVEELTRRKSEIEIEIEKLTEARRLCPDLEPVRDVFKEKLVAKKAEKKHLDDSIKRFNHITLSLEQSLEYIRVCRHDIADLKSKRKRYVDLQEWLGENLSKKIVKIESEIEIEEAHMSDLYRLRKSFIKNAMLSLIEFSNGKTDFYRLITDGPNGVVWGISLNNIRVFFETDTLEDHPEDETALINRLSKLTDGFIDMKIRDATGGWDSCMSAWLICQFKKCFDERKISYQELLDKSFIHKSYHPRALVIIECFFRATFVKVLSWILFRCKDANLGNVPNNASVANEINKFVTKKIVMFVREDLNHVLKGGSSFIQDSKSSFGFNVFTDYEDKNS